MSSVRRGQVRIVVHCSTNNTICTKYSRKQEKIQSHKYITVQCMYLQLSVMISLYMTHIQKLELVIGIFDGFRASVECHIFTMTDNYSVCH